MRYLIILMALLTFILPANAKHIHYEKEYQEYWCSQNKGVTEYVLPDKTRVDCLTDNYAVEFDFANKVYESVGQALYYALMTKKKAGIVLIMENPDTEQKYLNRLKAIAKTYNINYWIIYPKDIEKM